MPAVSAPVAALAIFAAAFALAAWRGVHLGLVMFVAACLTGVTLAGMSLREVMAGFPVSLLMLVAGVTWFFGIARLNGTVDRVIGALVRRTGGRPAAVPVLFFGVSALAAAMGAPQSGLATGPMGMAAGRTAGVDAVLMAIALNGGISAGSFAPTSLFGVVTHRIARDASIAVSPMALLVASTLANLLLLVVALAIFKAGSGPDRRDTGGPALADVSAHGPAAAAPRGVHQTLTLVLLLALVPGLIVSTLIGVEPDVGVVLLGMGVVLALGDPALGTRAFALIDWSTALVVCGIVTYVGVLQRLDAVNLLGREAMAIGSPLVAALVVCMIAALVSAFASTTAVLAALVPMAVPLATSGAVPGWALITTLGVAATVVDSSPFSNTGATLIASAADDERARMRRVLLRWSLAMVVVGPLVTLPVLMLFD